MELFIEQVKLHPCLWDMSDAAYKDFEVMERAWTEVALATNYADGKAAKMQWKKLRDNFREALKRQKDSKGAARVWRYQQEMEFLRPYMQSKNGDLICEDKSATENAPVLPYLDVMTIDDEVVEDTNSNHHQPNKKRKDCFPYPYVEVPKVTEDLSRSGLSGGRNPLLDFFNSMYNTTQELPSQLQLQVKKKVFDIVSEAEEASLILQEQIEKQNKEYTAKDFL